MRELREFRVHHREFVAQGVAVAGVSRDGSFLNRWWSRRLNIPFPLLSDREGEAARALGIVRRVPLGIWTLELVRRSTLLVDRDGRIAAVWTDVHVRGHAREVLASAGALGGTTGPARD